MSKEISHDEAVRRLEESVKDVNLIEHFLGSNKDSFLRTYRALHSQLRDGDSLNIEASLKIRETKLVDIPTIYFEIIFTSNGKKETIYHYNSKEGFERRKDNLLYSDKITYSPKGEETRETQ